MRTAFTNRINRTSNAYNIIHWAWRPLLVNRVGQGLLSSGQRVNMGVNPWRRLWHLIGGSFFPVLAIFIPRLGLLISLGVLMATCVTWEILRFTSPRVNLWLVSHLGSFLKRGERGFQLTGTTYLLLASLVVFICFERDVAILGLLFLAVGDLVAAIIGRRWGRFRVFEKSLEGGLACLASCFIIGVVASILSPVISLAMAAIGAAIATIVELLPIRINDNLTIPIVSGGVMTLIAPVMG